MTWPLAKLGDVCQQARLSIKPGQSAELPYIGLECIEAGTGRLLNGGMSKTPETPHANSFGFDSRHVLYGKLRPYLNKVALPDVAGKCSTEIVPLLPDEKLDRRYLAFFLRNTATVNRISEKVSGARMPRADMVVVFDLDLPLPPLPEQRRIVDLLTRAEGIVRLRREAAAKAAELIPALFIHHFGDPATNPMGWPVVPLGDGLRAADYGCSTKAHAEGEGVPLIRMGNVTYAGDMDLSDLKFVQLDSAEQTKYELLAGDLLFNRTNSKELVGKTGLWAGQREAVVASYFIRLRVDPTRLVPTYLWAYMNSGFMKKVLFGTARGAIGQANINSKELKAFPVPLPPTALQQLFAERVVAIQSIVGQQTTALAKAQSTFDALLAQAFAPA
jgi:type I restriction enzyme S subunit